MKANFRLITVILIVVLLSLTYCDRKQEQEARQISSETAPIEQKDTVLTPEDLAQDTMPSAGELTISSFGPQGEVQGQVQIKIDFPRPLVPLATLSDARRVPSSAGFGGACTWSLSQLTVP